ncbi:MAG: BMC domain-containing protein [Lachnospiraceae bacterium]|nr:BMC domain-containing protein [Lachnospiraceae bacterium]
MKKAYGFFEIPSTTAAITALDMMCKSASVEFVTWEKKLGGRLVTIIIEGSVADVKQAIETAKLNAIKPPACTVVIPNPHPEIVRMVEKSHLQMMKDKII